MEALLRLRKSLNSAEVNASSRRSAIGVRVVLHFWVMSAPHVIESAFSIWLDTSRRTQDLCGVVSTASTTRKKYGPFCSQPLGVTGYWFPIGYIAELGNHASAKLHQAHTHRLLQISFCSEEALANAALPEQIKNTE